MTPLAYTPIRPVFVPTVHFSHHHGPSRPLTDGEQAVVSAGFCGIGLFLVILGLVMARMFWRDKNVDVETRVVFLMLTMMITVPGVFLFIIPFLCVQ